MMPHLINNALQWLDFAKDNALLIGILLALTTLLFEDVAIAAAAGLILQATMAPLPAFLWVSGGIAAGDIGLYALGRTARRWPWLAHKLNHKRAQKIAHSLNSNLFSILILARIIPGLRTVTFSAAGLFKSNFITFCSIVIPAVLIWTAALLFAGVKLVDFISEATGIGMPYVITIVISLLFLPMIWHAVRQFYRRRAEA
jgi:membrane protein DedA with SNARE-associated domain